jgi:uncharacterized protein with beta-barrel porin domain
MKKIVFVLMVTGSFIVSVMSVVNADVITVLEWEFELNINGTFLDDTITNSGVVADYIDSGEGDDTITISGRVGNYIYSGDGADTITNSGIVYGNINSGNGDNTVTNSGTVAGSIYCYGIVGSTHYLFGGDDIITNSGTVGAYIDSGDGADTIMNYGTVGTYIYSGRGDDIITNSGTVGAYIDSDDGVAKIMNSGTIGTYISSGDRDDTITNSGTIGTYISSGDGDDTITNSGTVGSDIYAGEGADTITNSGIVVGFINSDYGADTITNSGSVGAYIDSRYGDNTITNSGTVGSFIYSGDGDDTITNSGTVGTYIESGDGADTITNSGTVGTYIESGDGANIITNSGTVGGFIYSGDGADTITNSGSVGGFIDSGDGDDTISNYGSVGRDILSGSGDDTVSLYAGSTLSGVANGGDGTDTLSLYSIGTVDGNNYLNFEYLELYGNSNRLTGEWLIDGGSTTLHDGELTLDGTLQTSSLIIENGGILSGGGTIIGDVNSYGTISPGNSVGTLTIDGSLNFLSGSTYMVELKANGQSDLIDASGQVTISGSSLDVSLERALYTDGTKWRIIKADGGVSGRFSSIDTDFRSCTIDLQQQVSGNSVSLVIDRTPYVTFAETENQTAVGMAMDDILVEATGSMENLMINMDFTMGPSELTATLEGLNPEMYTVFPSSGLRMAETFSRAVAFRQQEIITGQSMDTAEEGTPLWSAWARALGDWFERDTEDDFSGYSLDTAGIVFGMDRAFVSSAVSTIRTGLLLGYADGDLSWDDSTDSGDISSKHVGVYTTGSFHGFYLNAEFGYAWVDNSAEREIVTPAFSAVAESSFDGDVLGGSIDSGYDFIFGHFRIGPILSLSYQHLDQEGFSESGAGDLGVHMDDCTYESLTGTYGLRLANDFHYRQWSFLPDVRLAMLHQFKDDAVDMDASFIGYQDNTFTVTGVEPDTDSALVSAGMTVAFNDRFSMRLSYVASFSSNEEGHLLSGGLVFAF